MRKGLYFIFFMTLKITAFAQFSELGVTAGYAVYNGTIDVTYSNFIQQSRMFFGAFCKYRLNDELYIRAQASETELYADEKRFPASDFRFQRGLNFRTPLTELIVTGEWHLFTFGENVSNNSLTKRFNLYILGGIGMANFTPRPNADGINVPDNLSQTIEINGTNQNAILIPIGGGIRYMFSENLALSAEIIGRKTSSLFIDGFNSVSTNRDDYYYTGVISAAYVFSGKSKNHLGLNGNKNLGSNCPRF